MMAGLKSLTKDAHIKERRWGHSKNGEMADICLMKHQARNSHRRLWPFNLRLTNAVRAIQVIACAAACGCAVNSDGSISPGFRGSRAWHQNAPAADVVAHYDKMSLEELCENWWLSHRSGSSPSAAGDNAKLDALARRGKSLQDCRPGTDAVLRPLK